MTYTNNMSNGNTLGTGKIYPVIHIDGSVENIRVKTVMKTSEEGWYYNSFGEKVNYPARALAYIEKEDRTSFCGTFHIQGTYIKPRTMTVDAPIQFLAKNNEPCFLCLDGETLGNVRAVLTGQKSEDECDNVLTGVFTRLKWYAQGRYA